MTFVPKFILTLSANGFTEANIRVIVLASPAHTTADIADSTISEIGFIDYCLNFKTSNIN